MEVQEKEPNKKSLEQIRADYALKAVEKWKNHAWEKDAAQRVKELPLMIRNNGLGQTLAVLTKESKKREESKALLTALMIWLLVNSPVKAYPGVNGNNPENLLKACFEGTRAQYQLAQQEAIAFLGWVKIMAEALIQTEIQGDAQRT